MEAHWVWQLCFLRTSFPISRSIRHITPMDNEEVVMKRGVLRTEMLCVENFFFTIHWAFKLWMIFGKGKEDAWIFFYFSLVILKFCVWSFTASKKGLLRIEINLKKYKIAVISFPAGCQKYKPCLILFTFSSPKHRIWKFTFALPKHRLWNITFALPKHEMQVVAFLPL